MKVRFWFHPWRCETVWDWDIFQEWLTEALSHYGGEVQ